MVFPTSTGKRLAARMLCGTVAQLRSLWAPHLDKRESHSYGCASPFLLLLWRCLNSAVRVKRCATTPWHGVPFDARGRPCSSVSWHDTRGHVVVSRAGYRASKSRPSISHNTTCHSDPSSSRHSANIIRPPPVHLPIAETETTPARIATFMTTWILAQNQNAARA